MKGAEALLLSAGLAPLAGAQQAFPPPAPTYPTEPGPVGVVNPAPMELKVRRVKDAVEVVIENTGTGPQLEQSSGGGSWMGRLYTSRPSALLRGPQTVSVPDAGFARISIEGGGTVYNLRVTPVPGYPVRAPLVSADGRNVVLSFAAPAMPSQQTFRRNTLAPGAVANPVFAPPLRQRASAPPVGDMAVGTMVLRDPNTLNVSGPPITLTFRGVRADLALMVLAKTGGHGFVYQNPQADIDKEESKEENAQNSNNNKSAPKIYATFNNESYSSAFNIILASTGLQAKKIGKTIVAGPAVWKMNIGSVASKTYRLNQASPKSAAEYLASLGALIRVPNTSYTVQSEGNAVSTGSASSGQAGVASAGQTASNVSSTSATTTTIQEYGANSGPLVGVSGTIDSRLGTITITGQPSLIAIAEKFIKQLDLRKRQVALSVRILDVSLGNDKTIDNSFAFRYGNSFIVNQEGQLLANFGGLKPPNTAEGGLPGQYNGVFGSPIVGAGSFRLPGQGTDSGFFFTPNANPNIPSPGNVPFYNPNYPVRPSFGPFNNPGLGGVVRFTPGTPSTPASPGTPTVTTTVNGVVSTTPGLPATPAKEGTPDTYTFGNPTAFQYPSNQLFDFVRAVIESRSTKVLASPTIILSEESVDLGNDDSQGSSNDSASASANTSTYVSKIGRKKANESAVVVGEQVITSFNVQAGQNGAPNTCQPKLSVAGLTFGARVTKIDDNGFVTFSLSPSISGAVRRERVEGCGFIDILSVRTLDTGSARVRDGQTLILTGVISDRDIEQVTKWPVLGDLPLIGQFFRNTGGNREKRELVVMVTPRIINDTEGGTFGYGYEPTTRDARQFMTPSVSTPMPSAFPQP